MVNDIAAEQVDTVKHAAKFIDSLAHYLEPGCQCNADELVKCLQGEGVKHGNAMNINHDVRHTLKSQCAKDTGCHLKGWRENRPYHKAMHHEAKDMKHEVMHMAREVHHDFLKEMKDQHKNVDHITKDFLKEARERYTQWGCEPKCTEHHTRDFRKLHGMKHCKCPGAISISGDTKEIF